MNINNNFIILSSKIVVLKIYYLKLFLKIKMKNYIIT